ncbi:MAG TPA: dihydropteroate synthase [Gemmatimonadaceae bacterium]|nr:dihydropteroate synthase [Gemmatimonadaceae bacterium]
MIEARDPSAESNRLWRAGSREIRLDRPIVIGILNVTPDSFSDGGNFFALDAAVSHAARMLGDGADIIDIGGESTRPGAAGVRETEESRRVAPVVRAIREAWPDVPISIDTTKATVAAEAIDAGADIVNDVSAMRFDYEMPAVVAQSGSGVILMHSRGSLEEMATYAHAVYLPDVTGEVIGQLQERILVAEDSGIPRGRICIDPGFGFSKTGDHSRKVLRELDRIVALGFPVVAGPSRKRFVSERADGKDVTLEDRDAGTVAACVMALERGAMLFRVHNVRAARRALDVAWEALHVTTG